MNLTQKACMSIIGMLTGWTVASELNLIPVPKLMVAFTILIGCIAVIAVNENGKDEL